MADTENPSNTPTQSDSTPVQAPFTPAPKTPVPGAVTSAPLTGQGPHKVEDHVPPHEAPAAQPAIPKRPPASPPRRPPNQSPQPAPAQIQPVTPVLPVAAEPPLVQPLPQVGNVQLPWHTGMMIGPTPMGGVDPAMTSLLQQTMNLQRQVAQKFILMILPEDGWPTCEEFTEVQQLTDRIKGLIGTQCCLLAFMGYRLEITDGPHRYLQTPMGMLPLYDLPKPTDVKAAKFGWVGSDLDTPQAPINEVEETNDPEEADYLGIETSPDGIEHVSDQHPAAGPMVGGTPMF